MEKKTLFIFLFFLVLPLFMVFSQGDSPTGNQKKLLEEELSKLEAQIDQYEKDITKTESEKKTLKNQITILKKKINKFDLQIEEGNVMISDLGIQIVDTESSINKTEENINDSQKKLAKILRAIYEEDHKSQIEILLSSEKLSDFFDNLTYLENLGLKNKELLGNIKKLKGYLEEQKQDLEEDKTGLEKTVKTQTSQLRESEAMKKEKDYFLKLTEGEYQKYLKEKAATEKKAAEIRSRLFDLIGVREAPKYEDAVSITKDIGRLTGIRPAFLLGILTQESSMGKDVGNCYLKNEDTGMGVKFKTNKIWPRVMKPKWTEDFFRIIEGLSKEKKLNLDPYTTPISCWIPACVNNATYKVYQGSSYVSVDANGGITCDCKNCSPFGWGGAMGPAQLMPFNWLGSGNYGEKIAKMTGSAADPWDFYDSTLGAALHLQDCRADLSEKEAAACYFGGWSNRKNAYHNRVYSSPVLALAKCHQNFIDKGTMSESCESRIF